MISIAERERQTYDAIWQGVPSYREHSPGLANVDRFLEMTGATSGSVLDAGCGAGVAGTALAERGFAVTLCDQTNSGVSADHSLPFVEACLWHDLSPVAYLGSVARGDTATRFDYVYCCDVLEHVPTEYTMLVLSRLMSVAERGMFLTISLVPDAFGVWVGQRLHQTVKPFTWWRDRLADLGRVVEARDCLNTGIYWVERAR